LVFRPENQTVHIFRCKRYPPDLLGVHRIANQNISFPNPVHQPVTVKSGNVRTPAAADNHDMLHEIIMWLFWITFYEMVAVKNKQEKPLRYEEEAFLVIFSAFLNLILFLDVCVRPWRDSRSRIVEQRIGVCLTG